RGTSTWKAGGVWTDKSVFTDAASFVAAEKDAPADLTVGNNNFLVSLSALASNKEVVGQSAVPTDTMLVLDLSNSMDTSQSVPSMISAANATIKALLEMNDNNRVGVVLYSGNTSSNQAAQTSSATVILPLDRYTAASDSTYLTCTVSSGSDNQGGGKGDGKGDNGGNSYDTTVSVTSGVKNSDGTITGSKQTDGGTYIQNGLYKAWGEFNSVKNVLVTDGVQAGTQRQPILVLMSDGAPTVATTSYNNVGSSNQGDGTSTNDRYAFLTQLTAAWVKAKVSEKYNNTTMKFYTLGLGTGNSEQATSVLYPSGSNSTITGYWSNYLKTDDGKSVSVGSGNQSITVTRDGAVTAMNYVDRYWKADNADQMVSAFKEIVSDIQLQTAYSATLVESGDTDLDGYITIEDELGAMMQVKDIKGILLGNVLFTGEEMAESLNTGSMGTFDNPSEYGNEFVRTVMERIGTANTSETQQLISAAYTAGQLSYDEDTGAYSNYIGWYGDADNNYLGFWQESDGYTGENAPEKAVYINKSYGYLGRSHESSDADMMHIVVMVHTEIKTGDQTVLFKVPSSLIPMVTYTVEVSNDEETKYKLTVKETDPIRLLYEVGLPDDVNSVNLEQKVAEYLAKDKTNHAHTDDNGNYVFYANGWAADQNDKAPVISDLTEAQKLELKDSVAESHFVPNTINERYYIQEDSLIYTNEGSQHVPVTSQPVEGGTYYFARTIINVTGADGAAEAVTQYEQLYDATVANRDNFQKNADGNWEVKAGTIRQTLSGLALEKSNNVTGTLSESDHLWVDINSEDAADYNIYSFLGNNGKLTVAPAQGIKVTKNVTELAQGASADEKFEIVVTLDEAEDGIMVTDGDGAELEGAVVSADKKTVTLSLADGQTAYITGLTTGTSYTVEEKANEKYTASYT
ncbi:MAG: VWA domain-containing protein, partial [Oscillospiraceae bacterium]|nr:VWA domain-containing protein [Oscillospiraceae bacterium]